MKGGVRLIYLCLSCFVVNFLTGFFEIKDGVFPRLKMGCVLLYIQVSFL